MAQTSRSKPAGRTDHGRAAETGAAIGQMLRGTLAALPAAAVPAETVSPDLARLIARAEAVSAAVARATEEERWSDPVINEAGKLRTRILEYPSLGMAETMAKLRCINRIAGPDYIADTLRLARETWSTASIDDMILGVFLELSKFDAVVGERRAEP